MSTGSSRGRSAPRSKKGCWTCRERKVKCDEGTPHCHRCTRAGRACTYTAPPRRDKRTPGSAPVAQASTSPSPASPRLDVEGQLSPDDPEEDNRIMKFYQEQYLSFLTTKSPKWSFIAGIVYLGRTSSAVMNFIMANVRFQASVVEHRDRDRYQALEHYQTGLRDFATLVGSGEYEPLTLLGTLFLLVQFEMRHAEQAEDISRHLQGFSSAVLMHGDQLIPGLAESTTTGLSPSSISDSEERPVQIRYQNVLNRLGLWMTYMDAISSTWDLGGSVMQTFMADYPGALDAIFAKSRQAGQEIWGADYPVSEALDDLQNRPAFDLYHKAHILRYRVSCYRQLLGKHEASNTSSAIEILALEIETAIESLTNVRGSLTPQSKLSLTEGQEYRVLLDIALQWCPPSAHAQRITLNLHFIVPFFFASVVEFKSLSVDKGQDSTPAGSALSGILKIATIVFETESPQSMCRLAWPLFIAGAETSDFVHQNWVLQRFLALREFGVSYCRAYDVLGKVVAQQRLTNKRVDYRQLIKSQAEFSAFII